MPPRGPKFFNILWFLGKIGKIVCWHSLPRGLALPPWGNPGSDTGFVITMLIQIDNVWINTIMAGPATPPEPLS